MRSANSLAVSAFSSASRVCRFAICSSSSSSSCAIPTLSARTACRATRSSQLPHSSPASISCSVEKPRRVISPSAISQSPSPTGAVSPAFNRRLPARPRRRMPGPLTQRMSPTGRTASPSERLTSSPASIGVKSRGGSSSSPSRASSGPSHCSKASAAAAGSASAMRRSSSRSIRSTRAPGAGRTTVVNRPGSSPGISVPAPTDMSGRQRPSLSVSSPLTAMKRSALPSATYHHWPGSPETIVVASMWVPASRSSSIRLS